MKRTTVIEINPDRLRNLLDMLIREHHQHVGDVILTQTDVERLVSGANELKITVSEDNTEMRLWVTS